MLFDHIPCRWLTYHPVSRATGEELLLPWEVVKRLSVFYVIFISVREMNIVYSFNPTNRLASCPLVARKEDTPFSYLLALLQYTTPTDLPPNLYFNLIMHHSRGQGQDRQCGGCIIIFAGVFSLNFNTTHTTGYQRFLQSTSVIIGYLSYYKLLQVIIGYYSLLL